MGQPALEQKLRNAVNQKTTTEAQALYIMAETRKLMEVTKVQNNYPGLNFYCNWALHPTISGSAEGKRIVAIFDRAERFFSQMANTQPEQQIANPDWSWRQELTDILDLRNLKREFQSLCTIHNIDGRLITDQSEWLRFLNLYAGIIEDVPLKSSDPTLQYVKEVTTTRMPIDPNAGINASEVGKKYTMQLSWEWKSPSGMDKAMPMLFSDTLIPTSGLHRFWLLVCLYARKLRYHIFDRHRKKR
jgi:hypothetical protein